MTTLIPAIGTCTFDTGGERQEANLIYGAMTRATQELVLCGMGEVYGVALP